jgi:predicted ATP-dependent serine protease
MGSIIGREQELALVDGFVTGRSGCLACLLLEGDAGIGKSTLWRAGVEMALERGFRVLLSRSAEAERDLPYVGLGDLFEGALAEVLP